MIFELSFHSVIMTTDAIHTKKNGFPVFFDFFGDVAKVHQFEKVKALLDLLIMSKLGNATCSEGFLPGDFFIGLNGLGIVGLERLFL